MKTDNSKKLKMYTLLSKLIMVVGFLLLVFMIYTEDEPGAIPLFLVLVGTGWYFITRFRMRSQRQAK